jgi:hypothetical protein
LVVGKHIVEQLGPDVLLMRLLGELTAEETRQLIILDREQARRNGYSLVLIDGTQLAGYGSEARQATFDEMRRHSGYMGSTAIYGLSGTLTWLMKLVLRGVGVLASYIDDEVQLFATEEEARAFLNKRRPLRQSQASSRRASGSHGKP